MRESIGATWIFSICLTFIILFTAYLAISVNYAKAFRIKNYIVSNIEENEGYTGELRDKIESYLFSEGYTANGTCPDKINVNGQTTDWKLYRDGCINKNGSNCGACIYRINVDNKNDEIAAGRSYYKVMVFFQFDLPVVNYFTKFRVSGDTRYIYNFAP